MTAGRPTHWTLPDAEATQAFAARFARHLAAHGPESVVIGLIGDLGAGKTTFVQGFVAGLAPDEDHYVTSPTFAIAQAYDTTPPVRHLDLYRLADYDELAAIGDRDLLHAPGFALVEWIDQIPEAAPPEWIALRLAVADGDVRRLEATGYGAALSRLVEDFANAII